MTKVKLSLVVSVYNEFEALELFYEEAILQLNKLDISYKIIFVNDGSTDGSIDVLNKIADNNSKVYVINFSRNFGHEAAMLAGIDKSNSEAIICMDSDLQHPPALIGEMLSHFDKGSHIVNMVRNDRLDGGFLNKLFSKIFYGLINKMSEFKLEPNASDFFLISDRVAEVIRTDYRERTRFLRGLIQIIGFSKSRIEFVAPERIAGESKYSFLKLLIFSFSAISVLSKAPLRIGIYTGMFFAFMSLFVGSYSFAMWFIDRPIPGYSTIVILISTMFSIQFFVLGILGDYIGYIFDEVKQRPHYIIENEFNEK
ncbi:MAG: glycosyl transferase family 2 [Bacteroidetes bacterium 4572_112]|nr:MAG: glycosyl transferase family 2 [Bacteroidetes bacterium 4572_112]